MQIRMFIILLCLFGMSLTAYAQDEASPLPANLAVPEGNTLFLTLIGDGVQIYRCAENSEAEGTYLWTFVAPHADLMTISDERMGIHYVGPSWEANDGSIVRAEVLERAESPDGAIPWLLLRTTSVTGNGVFSHVNYIQRLDTLHGTAPVADTCTEAQSGTTSRVHYRALYRFFTADPVNMNPAGIPDSIEVPEGSTAVYQIHAEGVQIYRCQESTETAGTFVWTFVGPEADLLNEVDERVGIHYGGPTWESNDGSMVVGEVLERAESGDGAIPWLLLRVVSTQGNGVFSGVNFIHRLDTVGGTAPAAELCTPELDQRITRVPYSALYVFYAEA